MQERVPAALGADRQAKRA